MLHVLVQSFQHRSVYCAEQLAKHITDIFPSVQVEIRHNERENWP